MAWSTPPTWYPGLIITSAQLNILRDDLLETPAAKATTAGTLFVGTGPNGIAERFLLEHAVATTEAIASPTYTSLTTNGPSVTLTTGGKALVWINAGLLNSATGTTLASFEISGATTTAAADARAVLNDSGTAEHRGSACSLMATTAGVNTFRMLYRATSGTGSWRFRSIAVMAL